MAALCIGGIPQADISQNLITKVYPISPDEFNTAIGFACLNSEGDIVGEPPAEEEQVIIDAYEEEGTGGVLDALVDYNEDMAGGLPPDEGVLTRARSTSLSMPLLMMARAFTPTHPSMWKSQLLTEKTNPKLTIRLTLLIPLRKRA